MDMEKQREKALNIALNKLQGDWDLPFLKDYRETCGACSILHQKQQYVKMYCP